MVKQQASIWYFWSFPEKLPWGECHRKLDHFVNAPSQWETTLHRNFVSHWLGTFTKWSLQDLNNYDSTQAEVRAWCHHGLNQCWPRSMTPFNVTRGEPVYETEATNHLSIQHSTNQKQQNLIKTNWKALKTKLHQAHCNYTEHNGLYKDIPPHKWFHWN